MSYPVAVGIESGGKDDVPRDRKRLVVFEPIKTLQHDLERIELAMHNLAEDLAPYLVVGSSKPIAEQDGPREAPPSELYGVLEGLGRKAADLADRLQELGARVQ